jgi:hypothetical protein
MLALTLATGIGGRRFANSAEFLADIRQQACGAAGLRRKSALDPHYRPEHNQVRVIALAIRRKFAPSQATAELAVFVGGI